MSAKKLYIYDSSSSIDRSQAAGRFTGATGVATMGTPTIGALHDGLARLVSRGRTFKRLLFQTHGNSGSIFFNHNAITPAMLRTAFRGRYDRLFPGRTKIYFDGCNVAQGNDGWDFLLATGEAFLPRAGGIAIGFTSLGVGLPGWFPFVGGRTSHLTGGLRFIEFGRGGRETFRYPNGKARSISDLIKARRRLESY